MFFGSAVFWWLIWVRDHIMLPQQKEKAAKMNRSWPPNLPFVRNDCTTRSLNSFISSWSFLSQENLSKESKKNNVQQPTPLAELVSDGDKLLLILCVVETTWLAARWMDVMICASGDWKAAYHAWNRQAPDICHPQSFIFRFHSVFPATLSPLPKHPHRLSFSSLTPFTPALLLLPL